MVRGYRLENSSLVYCLVSFTSIFAFGIGSVHLFDLDELYFAEITREMMRTGQYSQVTFNFEPLYEKPPLFFWIQAASMHIWGINEIGARFPNLVCSVLTLTTIYYIGQAYKSRWFGFLWMALYATAFLPHFYFKSAIIDPFFNYFLLVAIYFLSHTLTHPKTELTFCGGLFIGCGLLAKGPMALIISVGTLLLPYIWFKERIVGAKQLILALCLAILVNSSWLIREVWSHGWTFIKKFWEYHLLLYNQPVEMHNQPWYYHYLVLFFGCFPTSLFTISHLNLKKLIQENYFSANMQALLVLVLLIFTLVGTKIVHYSSMAYFPITFFGAEWCHDLMARNSSRTISRWFLGVGLLIGGALAMIPWLMLHQESWMPFIKNGALKEALSLSVKWTYWDSLPGLIYMAGIGLSYYQLLQSYFVSFITTFMCSNMATLALFLMVIPPKVETYSQRSIINFCKAQKGKEVYLKTIGFKSAAPLFYADQPKSSAQRSLSWLLEGPIDKPCFFILYKNDQRLMADYPDITYMDHSGCFVFYKRLPQNAFLNGKRKN